jgi:hypothetical protein
VQSEGGGPVRCAISQDEEKFQGLICGGDQSAEDKEVFYTLEEDRTPRYKREGKKSDGKQKEKEGRKANERKSNEGIHRSLLLNQRYYFRKTPRKDPKQQICWLNESSKDASSNLKRQKCQKRIECSTRVSQSC